MRMGSRFAIALLTVGFTTAIAAEVLKPVEPKDFQKNSNLTCSDGVFTCKGTTTSVFSDKSFPVEPGKKYKISGMFRAKPGTDPTVLFFGYVPYDEKNATLSSASVCCIPKTETELAKAAKIGDTVLSVKDASQWNMKANFGVVAFNVKPDFADLPNTEIVAAVPGKIENRNGVWEVTLKAPLKKAYAEGTKIRQQTHGATYIYNGSAGRKTSADWQAFSGTISSHAKTGNPSTQWWPGTKSARIVMYVNYGAKGAPETEFKDIVVETID